MIRKIRSRFFGQERGKSLEVQYGCEYVGDSKVVVTSAAFELHAKLKRDSIQHLCMMQAPVGLLTDSKLLGSVFCVTTGRSTALWCFFLSDMRDGQIIVAEVFLKEEVSLRERPVRKT